MILMLYYEQFLQICRPLRPSPDPPWPALGYWSLRRRASPDRSVPSKLSPLEDAGPVLRSGRRGTDHGDPAERGSALSDHRDRVDRTAEGVLQPRWGRAADAQLDGLGQLERPGQAEGHRVAPGIVGRRAYLQRLGALPGV